MVKHINFFSRLLVPLLWFIASPMLLANTPLVDPNKLVQKKLEALETSSGGHLGIYAVNTANHERIRYHATERFHFQSTFKVMLVSAILKQSMRDHDLLQQKIRFKKRDIVFWSPITEKQLADGMTIFELSKAALQFSDNAATNLLIKKLGGLEAVVTFARSIDDHTFKLSHWEPTLNSTPGDSQDTSTPEAMGKNLQQLLLGKTLGLVQRMQLQTWLQHNTTGDHRIRAGVPKGWTVGDKTGSGDYGITNDIGIIWPQNCPPIVVAIYFIQNNKDALQKEDVVASATRLLIEAFAQNDRCMLRSIQPIQAHA